MKISYTSHDVRAASVRPGQLCRFGDGRMAVRMRLTGQLKARVGAAVAFHILDDDSCWTVMPASLVEVLPPTMLETL